MSKRFSCKYLTIWNLFAEGTRNDALDACQVLGSSGSSSIVHRKVQCIPIEIAAQYSPLLVISHIGKIDLSKYVHPFVNFLHFKWGIYRHVNQLVRNSNDKKFELWARGRGRRMLRHGLRYIKGTLICKKAPRILYLFPPFRTIYNKGSIHVELDSHSIKFIRNLRERSFIDDVLRNSIGALTSVEHRTT